jgi:hypothetical protein
VDSAIKAALGLIGALVVGCDQLTLPPRPAATNDGGGAAATTVDGGGGVVATGNTMIPAGAVSVQGTFGGDPGFFAWSTNDSAGKLATLAWSIPVATVKKAGAAELFDFLPLPQPVLDQTPIKSFSLQYLPHGHVPAGVYDVPHWEWHLGMITADDVNAIDCKDTAVPAKDKLPPNTVCLPTCLEKLGMHAFDLGAPEFNGQRFSHGVYGAYYKAAFIAVEPKMVTTILEQQPSFTMNSYDPSPLGTPGRYPKTWVVSYNAEQDSVVLTITEWFTKQ